MQEGDERVEEVIGHLGLGRCAHTKVGGDSGGVMVAGISGGERRRLSIACEIITDNTAVIMADEPTTGLDSFQVRFPLLLQAEACEPLGVHRSVSTVCA